MSSKAASNTKRGCHSRAQSGTDWRSRRTPSTSSSTSSSSSRSSHRVLSQGDAECGLMAFLPQNVPSSSRIYADDMVNSGAMGHPVVIVGTENGGQVSTCCVVTSFGSCTVQEKYGGRVDLPVTWSFAAIDHRGDTQAHNSLSVLKLANDQSMDKQSYISLSCFFKIETAYLERFRGGDHRLDHTSVPALQSVFRALLAGRLPRGRAVYSPLDDRRFTPQQLGVPDGPIFQIAGAPKAMHTGAWHYKNRHAPGWQQNGRMHVQAC